MLFIIEINNCYYYCWSVLPKPQRVVLVEQTMLSDLINNQIFHHVRIIISSDEAGKIHS